MYFFTFKNFTIHFILQIHICHWINVYVVYLQIYNIHSEVNICQVSRNLLLFLPFSVFLSIKKRYLNQPNFTETFLRNLVYWNWHLRFTHCILIEICADFSCLKLSLTFCEILQLFQIHSCHFLKTLLKIARSDLYGIRIYVDSFWIGRY